MIAVADSSSIILLAKIGRVDLLRDLFDQVVVPPAVREELSAGGARPGVAELGASPWISVRSVVIGAIGHRLARTAPVAVRV